MRSRISFALALSTCLGALAVACDGSGGPVLVPDAGPTDSGPPPVDAVPPDTERPRVAATAPEQGATSVSPATAIEISFSEPMDESAGTAVVRSDGSVVDAGAAWSDDGRTLTLTPSAALPSEARVEVTIEDDFADLAGNTLALPYVLAFVVADVDPPVVASSDPAQGASALSARLDEITITFDEAMDNSVGSLSLEGGAGTLEAPAWIDGRTLRAAVSGLAYETAYRVVLTGFEDAAGNALDASVYLDEGAIAFATGPDDDAPQAVDSVPSEGQVNVALRGTPSIVLVFDEPMDTSAGTATLLAGGLETVLAGGTWSDGDRRLTLPVAGRLYPNAPHSVLLEGFADTAGNRLDTEAYLGDGRLDFDTGADATVPIVVFSYPNEGSRTADHHLATIEVAFDRAMDQGVTTLRVDDGEAPFDAPVTWNLAGTRAYADVSERIHAGRAYAVDLRGFVDLNGDPVDPDAPYLADGILDFSTRAPRGEQCRDELRVTEATSTTSGGGYEWVIPETSMATADNGPVCRYGTSGSYSPDAVIRYRKTTTAGSSGGRYLHVTAETAAPDELTARRVTLAVYRDACGQASPGGPEGRLACHWDRYRWEQYLDVGEGDYYVWVANVSSTQTEITVRIEEVDTVPAGETCANPYQASTSEPIYTAPATADGEHVWQIPELGYHGADMGTEWPSDEAATCDADRVQGVDTVIEIPKTRADSLLDIVVEPGTSVSSGAYRLTAEARRTCDSATSAVACTSGIWRSSSAASAGPRRLTVAGPAGPAYLWLALQDQSNRSVDATVRVREIDDAPGSSCANAITVPVSGTTAITADSPARIEPPSCMRDVALAAGITWYRLTTTQLATMVRTDALSSDDIAAFAMIDAASGRELACNTGARDVPALALLPAGSDVCIAVRSGSGIGALEVGGHPYTGVMGVPTDLAIERPVSSTTGNPLSITADNWMVTTPTTLYMAISSGLVTAPRTGGVQAELRSLTSSQVGSAGVAVGEAVWSLDDSATSGTSTRLWRVVSPTGGVETTPWDTGTSWPSDAFDAMAYDGTAFYVANDYAASVPVAIRRFEPDAAGAATPVGAIGDGARDTIGLAADATWFFFAGAVQVDATTSERGVFRVRRDQLGTAAPERIATVPLTSSPTSSTLVARAPMFVDSVTAASYLYVRAGTGEVHVIADPGGATPTYLGALSPLGKTGDFAMAYDPSGPSIFLFETETVSTGRFVRLD